MSNLREFIEAFVQRRQSERLDLYRLQLKDMPLTKVKTLGQNLRPRRRVLNELLYDIDARLAQPIGFDPVERHGSTDWIWRPEVLMAPMACKSVTAIGVGQEIGPEVKLFHDCEKSELSLRQIRLNKARDYAPFGLAIEIFDFDGSFFSLVMDLPPEGVRDLGLQHIVQLDVALDLERPCELISRLNIKQGASLAQVVREIPLSSEGAPQGAMVEFDLTYAKIDERRIDKIWVDLIFANVEMNQITLRDISLSRRLRAQL